MMTFVWIIVGIVSFVLALFIFGWVNAIRASMARDRKLDEMVQPAIEAVREGKPSAKEIVTKLAETPITRNHLFTRLTEMGKVDLFPSEYRTNEKVAESDLARWLMHKNELGTAPSEMVLVQKVPLIDHDRSGSIFLFRFRTNPPHWAAENGWMAGVSGPFWDDETRPDFASGTFSELTPYDKMTVEQHVDFLREALKKKGFVVPS